MIGKIIKYMRKNKELSQEDLATLLQMNRTTLGNYETETRQPTFETIEKISNKCGYKIYFINEKEKFQGKDLERKDV